jgi:hypothetical protein
MWVALQTVVDLILIDYNEYSPNVTNCTPELRIKGLTVLIQLLATILKKALCFRTYAMFISLIFFRASDFELTSSFT